ncbi:MAG: lysylphosphatidylglycerol synthase domain-containing protein [Planctomycetota bacterium]
MKAAWPIVKWLLLALTLGLVGWALAGPIKTLLADPPSVDWRWVPASTAAAACVFLAQLVAYRALLHGLGHELSWRATAQCVWVPILGKYVPGKVWAIGTAATLLRSHGVPVAVALSCYLILDGLAVMFGLLFGGWLLPEQQIVAVVVVIAAIVVLHPAVFGQLIALGLRLTKKPPLERPLRFKDYFAPALSAIAQWVFYGLSTLLMLNALTNVGVEALPRCIATAALAQTIGYLALFAPGGLGVREGIYALGLSTVVSPELAAAVALLMRAQSIIVEAGAALTGLALGRRAAV